MLRTDLALEAKEMYHDKAKDITDIEGVKATSREEDGVIVTHVEVLNQKGSYSIGKPIGNYYTFEMPDFKEVGYAYYYIVTELLSEHLQQIISDLKNKTILVAGLGNRQITSDALGPFTVDKLIVTRHLHELVPDKTKGLGSICAISPSVLGMTGIETAEIIKGVCEKIKPAALIVVDALASRKMQRVATTIQMSDTGINPGSGIGNNRKEISEKTIGIPVVSIGVPMVVDVITIAYDAVLKNCTQCGDLLKKLEEKKQGSSTLFTVTPKDIDKLTLQMANIISAAINISAHNIQIDDIGKYIN